MKDSFKSATIIALDDIQLQTALDRGTTRAVNGRINAMSETTDAQALRQQAARARERALNKLPELLEQLEANVIKHGGKVLWARDGKAAPSPRGEQYRLYHHLGADHLGIRQGHHPQRQMCSARHAALD